MYFIATRLLRDSGAGPTILVSPLLALMRNQIRMAERAGVVARTINTENRDDREEITAAIEADRSTCSSSRPSGSTTRPSTPTSCWRPMVCWRVAISVRLLVRASSYPSLPADARQGSSLRATSARRSGLGQHQVDRLQDSSHVQRLRQVIGGARREQPPDLVRRRVRREDHDRDLRGRVMRSQLVQDRLAVDVRKGASSRTRSGARSRASSSPSRPSRAESSRTFGRCSRIRATTSGWTRCPRCRGPCRARPGRSRRPIPARLTTRPCAKMQANLALSP